MTTWRRCGTSSGSGAGDCRSPSREAPRRAHIAVSGVPRWDPWECRSHGIWPRPFGAWPRATASGNVYGFSKMSDPYLVCA